MSKGHPGLQLMTGSEFREEPRDFSVVPGGPTFLLFRWLRLCGDNLELLQRRVITVSLIAWLPLLLLVFIGSPAVDRGLFSFFHDIEVHVRFLLALPILLAAEVIVHTRTRPIVGRFLERRMVLPEDVPRFHKSVRSAIGLRNSIRLEIGLLLFVYTFGPWLTLRRIEPTLSTWYATPGGALNLSPAGFWYVFISVPIVQFLLLRWYLRLLIWFRFLWQVSRLELHLVPTHPDRAAGLAFLGRSAYAFSPILFAEGVLLAGLLSSEVLHRGRSLLSFKWEIGGTLTVLVFIILAPLLMFTPQMARAKRKGLADYGQLAQGYVDDFEGKWVLGRPTSEPILGSSDIQSLADLGNSYAIVREMGLVPFGLQDIGRLAAATAAPLLPLLLTIFSPEELVMRVFRVMF